MRILNHILFSTLCLLSAAVNAQALKLPNTFEATYTISRDGKPAAQQITTFSKINNNQYLLTDQTKGTHGLASMTGFKRNESTQFETNVSRITSIDHKMQQKVVFSKKSHRFKSDGNVITGKAKKPFKFETNNKPISTHMLPLWLSMMTCQGKKNITLEVLKSEQIKTYQFKVYEEPDHYRVERQYPKGKQRSTSTWLDKSRQCFPVRTVHQEKSEPIVETKLAHLKFDSFSD